MVCDGRTIYIYIYTLYLREKGPTTEYRPTPHFGLSFLLRSKVYSNMRPYVAALKHACTITIKWAWLRSLAVHDRSFEAETRHKPSSTAVWQVIFSIVPRLFEV